MNSFRSRERGNVLFLILIAVALFASLGFAVSNIMRSGNPTTIADEQARIFAGEILDYGRTLRQAIQTLRISNGCSDTDISFEGAASLSYAHTPVADDACKIFDPLGGGLSYLSPNSQILATSLPSGVFMHGEFLFGDLFIEGVGTAGDSELIARLRYLSKNICTAINDSLGIENPNDDAPVDANFTSYSQFDGDYLSVADASNTIDTPQTRGKMAGCVQMNGSPVQNGYYFYQVLLPR